jgi:hypothetical protein
MFYRSAWLAGERMTTPHIIDLCGEAWRLYDAWLALPPESEEAAEALERFQKHRRECEKCK